MTTHTHPARIATSCSITQVVPPDAALSQAVLNFDSYPDSALMSINDSGTIARRSRASIYRDHDAGFLPFVKIGRSTRIRAGDLRRYIAGGVQ